MSKEKSDDQVFEINRVRDLIELMKEHDLSEIDLRQSDKRIKLRRGPKNAPMTTMAPAVTTAEAPAISGDQPAVVEDDNAVYIKSPTIGTFYSRPKPDAENFVKVGDTVSPETIVCLVEAMKMFNEIPAGVSGRIIACLANNEDAVDVNKPLFKLAPL